MERSLNCICKRGFWAIIYLLLSGWFFLYFSQEIPEGFSSEAIQESTDIPDLPVFPLEGDILDRSKSSKLFVVEDRNERNNFHISLNVKDMDVVDVLKILADKGKLNLSISGDVQGRVTLFLKDIDIKEALEIILLSAGLAYQKRGEIIYIMPERSYELKYGRKYWDTRKVEVIKLNYVKANRVQAVISQIISRVGKIVVDEPTQTLIVIDVPEKIQEIKEIVKQMDTPLETKVFQLEYLPVGEIEEEAESILSREIGTVRIDRFTNRIIVTDYPSKIKEIEKLIKTFDVRPLQVLIDAKIIEVIPSKKFYSGINWDYWIRKYFRTTGTFGIPYSQSTDKFSLGTIGIADVSKKGDYKGILDFLSIFGETKILSSPRILVLNNQEAKILVGTKDAYITSSVSKIGEEAVTTQEVNFVDVGVKLFVTPTINRQGDITLKIKPEISSSETKQITSENKITEVPIVTTSEAETTVIVKDGVSVVIGGLRKVSHEKERKGVPFLGKVPLFGMFFRGEKDEWVKKELVIVLTPYIISGNKPIEEELRGHIENSEGESRVIKEFERELSWEEESRKRCIREYLDRYLKERISTQRRYIFY